MSESQGNQRKGMTCEVDKPCPSSQPLGRLMHEDHKFKVIRGKLVRLYLKIKMWAALTAKICRICVHFYSTCVGPRTEVGCPWLVVTGGGIYLMLIAINPNPLLSWQPRSRIWSTDQSLISPNFPLARNKICGHIQRNLGNVVFTLCRSLCCWKQILSGGGLSVTATVLNRLYEWCPWIQKVSWAEEDRCQYSQHRGLLMEPVF